MQQLASSFHRYGILPVFFFLLALGLVSCGGDGGDNGSSSNTLVIIPANSTTPITSTSVAFGDVVSVYAQLQDSSGTAVTTNSVTWTSDAPTIADVTPNGNVCGTTSTTYTCICGGQWQNSNVDCIAPSATSTAKVTATAPSGETASITVFVHPKIAKVSITTPPVTDCTSASGTLQLSAQAFDSNGNPVNLGNDATAFTWSTSDATVVTSDSKGLTTAVNPGKATVFATAEGHKSAPYQFTTCGVKSIHIHVKDATDTSFSGDVGTTKTLVADVLDTKGQSITITGSRLTWAANAGGVVTVDQSGGVTLSNPGVSGIVASCSPTTCNNGLNSVFSNVVTATANGTNTTTVFAASSSGTSLVPIDTSTNTVGTAITLPYVPNSMVFSANASKLFLGSATTLMSFDPVGLTVTSLSSLPGTVVAVSNNGQYVVIYDSVAGTITVFDSSNNVIVDRFSASGVPNPCTTSTGNQCPQASFTPDSRTAYIVAGSNLYVSSSSASLKTIPLGTAAHDITLSAQGSFAFIANNDATVVPFATCNNAKVNTNVTLAASAQHLIPSLDGSAIYALSPPNLNTISPTTDGVGCVPSLTVPLATVDLGQGTFTAQQSIISNNGNRIYFITGGNSIIVYDKDSNAGSTLSLASSANALSGGLTADGTQLYVGGNDSDVHRIDIANATDATQISIGFVPDLVVVRPK